MHGLEPKIKDNILISIYDTTCVHFFAHIFLWGKKTGNFLGKMTFNFDFAFNNELKVLYIKFTNGNHAYKARLKTCKNVKTSVFFNARKGYSIYVYFLKL